MNYHLCAFGSMEPSAHSTKCSVALCKPVLQKLYCSHQNPTPEQQVSIQLTLAVPSPHPDSISSTKACDTTIDMHITEEM